MLNASPKKLKSGSWGAAVDGAAKAGDELTITTKAGKSWTCWVEAVIWTGASKWSASGTCSIVSTTKEAPASPEAKLAELEKEDYGNACEAALAEVESGQPGSWCQYLSELDAAKKAVEAAALWPNAGEYDEPAEFPAEV